MSPVFWFLIGAFIVFDLCLTFFILRKISKRKRLPAASVVRVKRQWEAVLQVQDSHRRVLDAEKVVDSVLQELQFQGGFGDKLKKAGPLFSNIDAVWQAHKLRNRIAHEPDVKVSEAEADRAVRIFGNALNRFL